MDDPNRNELGHFKEGNTLTIKLASKELKIEAYEDYCRHIAEGNIRRSWRWRKDGRLMCTWKCMEKYIKEEPSVFLPIKKEQADCDGLGEWEKILTKCAKGQKIDGNTPSLPAIQMTMRNKFGWDAVENETVKDETKDDLDKFNEAQKETYDQSVEKDG